MPSPLVPNNPRIGGLRQLAPLGTLRSTTGRLLLAGLVLAAVLATWAATRERIESLSDITLVGHRSPVSQHVVLLLDESGSFADQATMRDNVWLQLANWAPANLRDDDTLTVIAFGDDAVLRYPTTQVSELATSPLLDRSEHPGAHTSIQPALRLAVDALGGSRPAHIIAVTDTLAADTDPSQISALVSELGATTMTVITPPGARLDGEWRSAFPWELHLKSRQDANSSAIAIGRALAHVTGQEVQAH